MTDAFVGLDPAWASVVVREWRRAAVDWRRAASDGDRLTSELALDAGAARLGHRLAADLEELADLLARRAAQLDSADDLVEWLATGRRGGLVTEVAEPSEGEWRAMVAAGSMHDGQRSVRFFEVPADPGAGVVVADFFIPERSSLFLDGDGRDHADPVFGSLTASDSRAVVVLDLEDGRGSVQFDDTCTAWAGPLQVCRSSRPVRLPGDDDWSWTIGNDVRIAATDDAVTVSYDILNGITPLGSTDGTFTLADGGDGRYSVSRLDADDYPSLGVYQYRRGKVRTLLRRDSAGVGHLWPWWPDRRDVRASIGPDFLPD